MQIDKWFHVSKGMLKEKFSCSLAKDYPKATSIISFSGLKVTYKIPLSSKSKISLLSIFVS
jgi:hypothetical protein